MGTSVKSLVGFDSFFKMLRNIDKASFTPEDFEDAVEHQLSSPSQLVLDEDTMVLITEILRKTCNLMDVQRISSICESFQRIKVGSMVIASHSYRRCSPYAKIIARFEKEDGHEFRPGIIQKIIKEKAINQKFHFLLEMQWYSQHPEKHFFGVNAKVEVWNAPSSEMSNPYIPARFVRARFVEVKDDIKLGRFMDRVSIIIPVPIKSLL